MAALLISCQESDNYRFLSNPIATFVSMYWPNADIESTTTQSDGSTVVIIHNGPEIVFDKSNSWTEIDGNGLPLPSVLLYDQLPSDLYRYIEETDNTQSVFTLKRTPLQYFVQLLDTSLTYDIATGDLRGN